MFHYYEKPKPVGDLQQLSLFCIKCIFCILTTKFSPYLRGFRKKYNTQYSLLKITDTWKNHLGKGEEIGVILIDLSKALTQ